MTQPPNEHHYYSHEPPRKPNAGLTFLGMSGGVLFLAIALVIVLPIIGCFVCLGLGVFGMAVAPEPSLTPGPASTTPIGN